MQVTFHAFDLAQWRKAGGEPAHIFPRKTTSEQWLVAISPVDLDLDAVPMRWATVAEEGHVMVPLMRYVTAPDPAAVVGFAAQVGAVVSYYLLEQTRHAPLRLHVVFGTAVEDANINQPAYAVYLGFAFQLTA